MKDVIKQIEEVLRKAGYEHVEAHSNDHFHTLSANKGEVRFVAHITDRQEAPAGGGHNPKAVPAMHIRPSFPVAEAFTPNLAAEEVAHAGHSDALELARTTDNVCNVC